MAYTTINKSSEHFNTKLYTGNGSTNAITGVGFQPDWTWLKSRSAATDNQLFDAVRGTGKLIISNTTVAESSGSNLLTAFGTDGFSLGDHSPLNSNGATYASWNWKANGAGSSNTDGSISSTVSANTTSGFSIVKFTPTGSAATIGHGLGVAPKMIIVKNLGGSSTWSVYHSSLGATKFLRLEGTNTVGTETGWWNDTAPTSSVFTLGSNINAVDTIAYCFAEKQGYSKIGSYTGNGNADGTFVYTGFSPAWVIQKPTDVTQNWQIHDTKRDGYNPKNDNLSSNSTSAESDNKFIDIVSNGFKLRRSDVLNVSGDNYIYMAFAEAPLVGSNNVPCTAR